LAELLNTMPSEPPIPADPSARPVAPASATEREKYLLQIFESDYRFLRLFDDAPDAILQVDARGGIVIANRTAEEMFGYGRTELLGLNVDLLIPEANRAAHADQRDQFMQSGAGRRLMGGGPGDLRARRKDGTVFPAEIALSRVKSEANLYVTAVIRDVTDRKRMERQLEEERTRRNQRIEALARLSSGLAHEIKNPLAIIHARASDLAEMASEGEVDRAQIAKTCASIVQTSDRAIRILRGIAAMARVGTHDPMQPASMYEIVEQAVDLVRGRYTTSGILLTMDLPLNLPMADCREVEISQVLVNLLNNAFDAVDGDSRSERWVRVQISTQPGVNYEDQIDRLQIEVIDGGPGVAAEHRERLMEAFFTTKPVGAGIGIGLSVSRAIAEDHRGQLEFRQSNGHTCFRLTLPVHEEKNEAAE
jgi:PAS domain S-box-containing protein